MSKPVPCFARLHPARRRSVCASILPAQENVIRGTVRNETAKTRAVTVCYVERFDATEPVWWNSVRDGVSAKQIREYANLTQARGGRDRAVIAVPVGVRHRERKRTRSCRAARHCAACGANRLPPRYPSSIFVLRPRADRARRPGASRHGSGRCCPLRRGSGMGLPRRRRQILRAFPQSVRAAGKSRGHLDAVHRPVESRGKWAIFPSLTTRATTASRPTVQRES